MVRNPFQSVLAKTLKDFGKIGKEGAVDTPMFADDTKVMRCIMSEVDSLGLQQDVHKLEQWSNRWLFRFNADKCQILTIGNIKHTHK